MVRPATSNDISFIARIHVSSWQAAYDGLIPHDFLSALDARKKEFLWAKVLNDEPGSLFVIEEESIVRGFCHFTRSRHKPLANSGEITSIYLDPGSYRQGMGTRLLAEVIDAASANYETIILWVLETNLSARRFYEKSGFTLEGSSKTEHGPGFDLKEVLYERSLNKD